MSGRPESQIRVSQVLRPDHTVVDERHAFQDLTGHFAIARCTHTAYVKELRPDDPSVPLCPLCRVFLMADEST